MYSVRLEAASTLHTAPPELIVEVRGLRGFDVMPDGREIVAASRVPDSAIVGRAQLVANWSEE